MTKRTLQISLLTFTLLYTINLSAGDKKPVDEGEKNVPKEDTIKGAAPVSTDYKYKEESLTTMNQVYVIKEQNLPYPPFTCAIYREKENKVLTLAMEKENNIEFNIEKSKLQIGDHIIIMNSLKVEVDNTPIKNQVILEIEIVK